MAAGFPLNRVGHYQSDRNQTSALGQVRFIFQRRRFGGSSRLISSRRQRLVCIRFLLPLAAFVAVASMRDEMERWVHT